MTTTYEPLVTRRLDLATKFEWLETNGIGGYASSTLPGVNTRKYHGLLVAALKPPLGRVVLISKLDETISCGEEHIPISTNQFEDAVYPNGYQHMEQFRRMLYPQFIFQAGRVRLSKSVVAIHGENTVAIAYKIEDAPCQVTLTLNPLFAFRDFHSNRNGADGPWPATWEADQQLQVTGPNGLSAYISAPGGAFEPRPDWYFNFHYPAEAERGEQSREDLFSPGLIRVQLYPGQQLTVLLSSDSVAGRNGLALIQAEESRRQAIIQLGAAKGPFFQQLALAADQFLVRRGDDLFSIIAGYPWFSDWGRDTMIALPGICLVNKRYEEARKILLAYASETNMGMIPNRFLDDGDSKEYNTVDATLWFFVAAYKFFKATGDRALIEQGLLPVMEEMLHFHLAGTRYGIRADDDGLLIAGQPGIQLTWMDAKSGDWVVTPRMGKPVEVNALWYNALKIYAFFLNTFGRFREAELWEKRANTTQAAFESKFWNPEFLCLYDVLGPDGPDNSIRPNQIFALSLPFPLLSGYKAELVLRTVERHLATPFGLRSLARSDTRYQGVYAGNRALRDGAYHQGTVWGWLLGPFIDAVNYIGDKDSMVQAREIVEMMQLHLNEAGIGSLSEIFDGDAPFQPRGCIAQAWTVSEMLRVLDEYPWTRGRVMGCKEPDAQQQPTKELRKATYSDLPASKLR